MEEQPDVMLESQPMPTPGSQGGSQRAASEPPPSSGGGQPGVAAAAAAAEQAREKEEGEEEGEGELDPPYVRYLEPTPDDLDLSVEYDVDEEDEEWLEVFNERVRACMCGCSGDGAAPEPCGAAWAHVCATRVNVPRLPLPPRCGTQHCSLCVHAAERRQGRALALQYWSSVRGDAAGPCPRTPPGPARRRARARAARRGTA